MDNANPPLDGVVITPLRQIVDQRGAVLHMLRADSPDFTHFGECYFSEVSAGAIKGWKRHRLQTQNLAVPVGRIRFVLFDGRDAGPTTGKIQILDLGRPDAYLRVRIPPFIWYSFGCIGDQPALIANCADRPHDPDESDLLPLENDHIPFQW